MNRRTTCALLTIFSMDGDVHAIANFHIVVDLFFVLLAQKGL